MFPLIVKTKIGDKIYRYLRIVESYRDKGSIHQRVVANLGNMDTIDKNSLAQLSNKLARYAGRYIPTRDNLQAISARHFGDCLIIKDIWEKLGISSMLNHHTKERKFTFNFALACLVMVCNRLIAPRSKLAINRWQKKIYLPELDKAKLVYQHFLRTLDYLHIIKEHMEKDIFQQLTDLFNLQLNLVFYDLTSTYFEGTQCPLSDFGYSRDKRSDTRQIILGLLVTDEGFPIAHEVFPGNTADKTTVVDAINILKKRFKIKQCIFVGDRGLVTDDNLSALSQSEFPYIVAIRKRNSTEIDTLLKQLPHNYKKINEQLWVKETYIQGIRYLFCYNPQKAKDDRKFRKKLFAHIIPQLKALHHNPKRGRKRTQPGALAKASEILALHKAKRYFKIGFTKNGRFYFRKNHKAISKELILDGVYILKTDVKNLEVHKLVDAYKNLSRVENTFRELKDFLHLRPIFHYAPNRVKAHVFICVLAYLIEIVLEKRLKTSSVNLSARDALDSLNTLRLIDNKVGKEILHCVTKPSKEQFKILKAVGILHLPRIL